MAALLMHKLIEALFEGGSPVYLDDASQGPENYQLLPLSQMASTS